MPKVRRIRTAALSAQASTRHAPLGQVIQEDEVKHQYAAMTSRRKKRNKNDEDDEDDGEELLDAKTTRNILILSRQQQREMEVEEMRLKRLAKKKKEQQEGTAAATANAAGRRVQFAHDANHSDDDDDDDDEDEEELQDEVEDYVTHDNGYVSVVEGTLSPEDEAIVERMMGGGKKKNNNNDNNNDNTMNDIDDDMDHDRPPTLADIIMAKIQEKEAMQRGEVNHNDDDENFGVELPPKVVQVYTDIGTILSRYTAGKLPKAFKVIPSLTNWEDVLYLTRPDLWTAQAMYAATKIFASNLNPKMAQRFYNLVLLDAVRADIVHNKTLNYHYYMALKKSVYKPAAFFKGILLPLCQSKEHCTLREATIIASVLQRVSIPVHHAAVALHKLSQQVEYNGACSIFIKTLLNKKYSLPTPVIAGLVQHFARFSTQNDNSMTTTTTTTSNNLMVLPVLWHQALLVFLQRYKNELSLSAKEQLKIVMKKQYHPKITPECRRELFGSDAFREERKRMNHEQTMITTTTTRMELS